MRRSKALLYARTLHKLGWTNAVTVALYRFRARRGRIANRIDTPLSPIAFQPIDAAMPPADGYLLADEAESLRNGGLRMFGEERPFDIARPNWFLNRLGGGAAPSHLPWWQISDADDSIGDIKGVWEVSRFDWALVLARALRTGDHVWATDALNHLIRNWCASNPPFVGPNWMCGQEVAIRMLQMLLAARLLDQDGAGTPGLVEFVREHLARIRPSCSYALAQDNNHGTSEAAAMFVGGAWLEAVTGKRWAHKENGRALLEERTRRLVFDDGGFAQYSTNYHRVLLETLSQAEFWRRQLGERPFSSRWYSRAIGATKWLASVTNGHTGDAPNLGANDGARPFRLDSLRFRDHRGSVQLAGALFLERRLFPEGPWDAACELLSVALPAEASSIPANRTRLFPDFGLASLSSGSAGSSYAFLRIPTDRFRPSQADPLHFDLWAADGTNLLRDGGTGSYADLDLSRSLHGIAGHNTVQFDGREPMPRLSRFLWADWIRGEVIEWSEDEGPLAFRYTDARRVTHTRRIQVAGDKWTVSDEFGGPWERAILRWRVAPGDWRLTSRGAKSARLSLRFLETAADPLIRRSGGLEAPTYGACAPVPVIEAEIDRRSPRIVTEITVLPE